MSVVSFLRETKSIGELSEIIVMGALASAGYLVSVPLGENRRYDLIIDKDGTLARVQVKTGRVRKGVVVWACCSSHTHRKGPASRPCPGEIDFFGVYCRELQSVYLIPIGATARLSGSLRLDPPRNGQSRKIRWANDYLLSTVPAVTLTVVGSEAPRGVRPADSQLPS